jgi:hypothetical protein
LDRLPRLTTTTNIYLRLLIISLSTLKYYATEKCDTETVIKCLETYCCIFGVPQIIQTDNGASFTSNNFNIFCDSFGIKVKHSTSYHAQSQGLVEKFNGTIVKMLSAYTGEDQKDWDQYVNLCTFAYNISSQKTTGITPHEAMFCRPATTSFSSLVNKQKATATTSEYAATMKRRAEEIDRTIKKNQDLSDQASKEYHDKNKTKHVSFEVGDRVWLDNPVTKVGLSKKLSPKVTGPWTIKSKPTNVNYEIEAEEGNKKSQVVHQNRLLPCYTPKLQKTENPELDIQHEKPKTKATLEAKDHNAANNDNNDDEEITWTFDTSKARKRRPDETVPKPKTDATARPENDHAEEEQMPIQIDINRSIIDESENESTDNDTDNNDSETQEENESENDNAFQDNTDEDPDYDPPKAAIPHQRAQSEDEQQARRYPAREHRRPARYTVNSIQVNDNTGNERTQVKKHVRFANLTKVKDKPRQPVKNNFYTRQMTGFKNLLLMTLCLSLLHASAAEQVPQTSETDQPQDIMPTGTDLMKLLGPANFCSPKPPHDATYIDLEPIDDCKIPDPREQHVEKILITPYFPRHLSSSFEIYVCTIETSTVETFYSFFGGKSINGRYTSYSSTSIEDCKRYTKQIKDKDSTFKEIFPQVYSDKSSQVQPEYQWCCTSHNISQNRIIIKQFEAIFNFHSKRIMSSNINLAQCTDMNQQSCITGSSTIIWEQQITHICAYTEGDTMTAEQCGNDIVSDQGQLAVTITTKKHLCDLLLWETNQDLFLHVDNYSSPVINPQAKVNTYLRRTDHDHTTTDIGMLSYVTHELETLTYDLFRRNYMSICKLRYQRFQMMKYLTKNGDHMHVARLLFNSSTVLDRRWKFFSSCKMRSS